MLHDRFSAVKMQELQERWNLLTAKLAALEQQKIAETRAEELFRLEQLVQQTLTARQQVEAESGRLQAQANDAGNLSQASLLESKKTTVLFIGANPVDTVRLRLDEEVRSIATILKQAKERDRLIFHQEWAATPDSLMGAILEHSPAIVHFSGHGEQEGICLEDERGKVKLVDAEALASLFKLFQDVVQCVLLNSCYSERQAKAMTMHLPYVIGMSSSIPDKTAISFAAGFYKAIGAGRSVPFAYELGKAAIQLHGEAGAELPVLLCQGHS